MPNMLPCVCSVLVVALIVSSARGQVDPPPLAESLVRCGVDTIGFVMPREALGWGLVLLSARDAAGILVNVNSAPSGCKFRLERPADGSLEFSAPNDGCYATALGSSRRMVFVMETTAYRITSRSTFSVSCVLGPRSLVVGDSDCPVSLSSRPLCDSPSAGLDSCLAKGCCYEDAGGGGDRSTCVYGNSVCTRDGHFVIVVPSGLASGLNLSSVRVQGSESRACGLVHVDDDFAVFRFGVAECGAVWKVEEGGGGVVYEATVAAERDVCTQDDVKVTRSGTYSFTLRCRYVGVVEGAMQLAVPTPTPPLPAHERGDLGVEMRLATDESYSAYYSVFPVIKFLRDPIFLEVRLLDHADPRLLLLLPTCWATPGPDRVGPILWPILQDGCPFDGDNYKTVVLGVEETPEVPLPGLYKRFEVKTFVFVVGASPNAIYDRVFFHCSAVVCRDGDANCVPPACVARRQRRVSDPSPHDWDADLPRGLASVGPLRLLEVPRELPMQLREARAASLWSDSLPPVVPTALSALALGTALFCGIAFSISACRQRLHRAEWPGRRSSDGSALDHFTL
ncbi:zona pellucida sperm-binding protein 4-like [Lampetra fluviatilis]